MIFCTRRKSKRDAEKRTRSWVPVLLRWRKRDVKPISMMNRVTSLVSQSYFPQVHLHFTSNLITQNHRWSLPTVFSKSTVKRERVLSERRFEKRIYTDKESRSPHAHRADRSLTLNHKTNSSTPRVSKVSVGTTRLQASRDASGPIRQIQQPRASGSIKSPLQLSHKRYEELTNVFQTHLKIREGRTQVFSDHSLAGPPQKTVRTQFDRSGEELVWRRTKPQGTVIEDGQVATITQTNQQQAVRTPVVHTHAQSAPISNNQTPSQQLTKLDPGLLDRLADDVIRRVEKRARIERQRRGL